MTYQIVELDDYKTNTFLSNYFIPSDGISFLDV
ncbi:Uncharacterised protein [Vibrio fluvialis]|jgi:hypothetical protein|uniref:Uncharacterized protein n=1 Tax=Vibrio fluvialis TaxID=676 RepID=A0AAX2LVU5_VIBFL|nr:Uncharacterised protein [Vibrio fluvialis]